MVLALCWASPAFAWSVSSLLGLWRLCGKRHQLSFLQRCSASVAQRFFMGCARLQVRAPFWPSGLTLRSSEPAFCGPLTLAVSPITRFMRTATYSSALPCPRGFQAFWASSAWAASATSYHFSSIASPSWRSAFSQLVPVTKSKLSVLASGSNISVKPTRLRRSAYLAR